MKWIIFLQCTLMGLIASLIVIGELGTHPVIILPIIHGVVFGIVYGSSKVNNEGDEQ